MAVSWTAGATVSTGDLITASTWNNYLGADGSLDYLKTYADITANDQVGVHLTKSGVQEIANESETALTWDTETWDTDSMHEGVTNPSRITIVTAGKYLVGYQITWEIEGAPNGYRQALLYKGGVSLSEGNTIDITIAEGTTKNHYSTILDLDADDYLEVKVLHDQGAATDVTTYSRFWAQRLCD